MPAIALLPDIHANLTELEEVLDQIARMNVDRIVCWPK